jgi:hypothetical protein
LKTPIGSGYSRAREAGPHRENAAAGIDADRPCL